MRALISVDLPAPLSPITARISPGNRSTSTPSRPDDAAESLDQSTTRQHRIFRIGKYWRVAEADGALLFLVSSLLSGMLVMPSPS